MCLPWRHNSTSFRPTSNVLLPMTCSSLHVCVTPVTEHDSRRAAGCPAHAPGFDCLLIDRRAPASTPQRQRAHFASFPPRGPLDIVPAALRLRPVPFDFSPYDAVLLD